MKLNNISDRSISIIMPTYNRAWCIEKAIKSVLNQTYGNWELIIVDDPSTDNTEEVVKNYLSDKRIKYFRFNERRGVHIARNRGIDEAKGEYIVFLDTDDKFYNNESLKKIVTQINKHKKLKVLLFRCVYGDSDKKVGFLKKESILIDYKSYISETGENFSGEFLAVVKTNLAKKVEITEPMGIFWLRLSKLTDFLYLDIVVRRYFINKKDGVTQSQKASLGRAKYVSSNYVRLISEFKSDYIKFAEPKLNKMIVEGFIWSKVANRTDHILFFLNQIKNRNRFKYYFYLLISILPHKIFMHPFKIIHKILLFKKSLWTPKLYR